jgi:hypothetical protein
MLIDLLFNFIFRVTVIWLVITATLILYSYLFEEEEESKE